MKNKLILGTAQFGLNYGINNSSGQPSVRKVFELLDLAYEKQIVSLDTADAYGNAIEQIGLYHKQRQHKFKILSKFKGVGKNGLQGRIKISLEMLKIPSLEVYSYHSFTDYINYPFLKDELLSLKSNGLIRKIGISVYKNQELQHVMLDNEIEVIQLPFNILDNNNIRGSYLAGAKSNNKEIHIRSVFLQGLLFMDNSLIPSKLNPLKPYLEKIKTLCEKESITMQSLALSYAIHNEHIDQVLIGVDTKYQLLSNLESIDNLQNAFKYIDQNIKVKETELLNPVNWK
jgi:aryl-alcohol dehydrogenase-like predicted oxidoreductase